MRFRSIALSLWLALLAASAHKPVSACSCVQQGASSPCRYFAQADAVFTGRVLQVADVSPADRRQVISSLKEAGYRLEDLGDIDWMLPRRVQFAVLQWFKGGSGPQAEIYAAMQPDTCGLSIAQGETYLVYASGSRHRLESDLCTGTALLEEAMDHLPLLERLRRKEPIREVYGSLPEGLPRPVGLALEGGGLRLTAAASGQGFRFTALPNGDYQVELRLPASFDPHPYRVHAAIEGDADCSQVHFEVQPSGSLLGVLRDASGKRVRAAAVSAQPMEDDSGPPLGFLAVTDKQGGFEIPHLQPGAYRLGVFLGEPRLAARRGFEPDWVSATTVKVAAGAIRRLADIRLSGRLEEVILNGILRWPDGRPAPDISVSLVSPAGNGIRDQTRTDSRGRFSLRGYRGLDYSLVAKSDQPLPFWAQEAIKLFAKQFVTLRFRQPK